MASKGYVKFPGAYIAMCWMQCAMYSIGKTSLTKADTQQEEDI